MRPEIERELAALRALAEAVRREEATPCGGTVKGMRDALRDVDRVQGRDSSEWANPEAA